MKLFTARIRKFRGKPVLEILAKTKESNGSFFVCYRESIDGQRTCRNLYFHYSYGYYCQGAPEKRMCEYILKKSPIIYRCDRTIHEDEVQILSEIDPNFKYIAKKTEISIFNAFNMFKFRKEHPEMEILLNMGFVNLAMTKSFFSIPKQKQRSIINYYLDYEKKIGTPIEDRRHTLLTDIRGAMKEGIAPKAYNFFRRNAKHMNIDIKTVCLMVEKNINVYDYYNYRQKLIEFFPDRLEDKYWTIFKDVHDFHEKENRVNTQVENIRNFLELKEQKSKQRKYTSAIKKANWQCEYNGLTVYIPKTIDDIANQAKILHQCLITCNYTSRVIDKSIFLVFIKRGDTPLATAELIRKDMTIGQFYGNELDRKNCLPPQECKDALDYFMNKFIRKCA